MPTKIAHNIVRKVISLDENKSVLEAAILMTEEFIGSVVVTNPTGLTGLFTERDLMMRVIGMKMDPKKVTLKDVMTRELIKVSPDDTAGRCLELMKDHRCRHLLVFNEGYFIGIVSLRDIVALMIEEKEAMIEQLQTYITS